MTELIILTLMLSPATLRKKLIFRCLDPEVLSFSHDPFIMGSLFGSALFSPHLTGNSACSTTDKTTIHLSISCYNLPSDVNKTSSYLNLSTVAKTDWISERVTFI
ncbi:hypothetical protein AMECASPLE_022554 [Ameca splendens]|uniref:Uncharacterized protein n=1 Tax=Ameca splendens TaxID=208324 RepID=A0ABV0YQR6_9TELE